MGSRESPPLRALHFVFETSEQPHEEQVRSQFPQKVLPTPDDVVPLMPLWCGHLELSTTTAPDEGRFTHRHPLRLHTSAEVHALQVLLNELECLLAAGMGIEFARPCSSLHAEVSIVRPTPAHPHPLLQGIDDGASFCFAFFGCLAARAATVAFPPAGTAVADGFFFFLPLRAARPAVEALHTCPPTFLCKRLTLPVSPPQLPPQVLHSRKGPGFRFSAGLARGLAAALRAAGGCCPPPG